MLRPLNSTRESATRLFALDLLRAVAVLLVIGVHVAVPPSAPAWLRAWNRGGWIGVDLFFVLSGFLVSGLLFREYTQKGTVNVVRFLIRRGFKIYPAFYCFLILTVAAVTVQKALPARQALVAEVLFCQSYFPGMWVHTWTLAVEEHFYVGIALLVAVLVRRQVETPLRVLPLCLIILAAGCLGLRIRNASVPFSCYTHIYPTHLRVDALGFGVLLSYFWHMHNHPCALLFRQWRVAVVGAGLALLLPAFLWDIEQTPWLQSFGLTGCYLGSGLLLMSLVANGFPENVVTRALAKAGEFSYSIYLWHLTVIYWILPRGFRLIGVDDPVATLLFAIAGSLVVGVAAARLVEIPALHLRERLFPAKSGGLLAGGRRESHESAVVGRTAAGTVS